jgi:hypothetical protein
MNRTWINLQYNLLSRTTFLKPHSNICSHVNVSAYHDVSLKFKSPLTQHLLCVCMLSLTCSRNVDRFRIQHTFFVFIVCRLFHPFSPPPPSNYVLFTQQCSYVPVRRNTASSMIYTGPQIHSYNSFLENIFCLSIFVSVARIFIIPGTHINGTSSISLCLLYLTCV